MSDLPSSVRIATVITYISAGISFVVGLLLLTSSVVGILLMAAAAGMVALTSRVSEGDRTSRNILVLLYALLFVVNIFLLPRGLTRMAVSAVVIYLLLLHRESREFFEEG